MVRSNLSEILGRKRIKMSELAKKAGINKNTVLNLYHDRSSRIEFEVLNKICNILECSPSDILHHTPDLETRFLEEGRFGAPIPKMNEAIKVEEGGYIDLTKDDVRRFRELEYHIEQEKKQKAMRGGYPKNQWGTMEIPVLSDADKPSDIDENEWERFMNWRKAGRPKAPKT